VTTFEAHADAFTTEGVMGIADGEVVAVEPFYAELKLPLEVTQGDVIQAPVTLVNQTEEPLSVDLTAQAAGPGVEILPAADGGPLSLRVPAQQRIRRLVPVRVTGELTGPQEITIAANTRSTRRDRLTRKLHVAPRGFPIEHTAGGVLEPGNRVSLDIVIPTTTVPGSLHASARVYPTPAANLTQAMERLIREPYGCF